MNLTRTAALSVAGGALAVWLAAAATSGTRPAGPVPVAPQSSADVRGEELKSEIARLHERLRPSAAPLQTRDLFRYSAKQPATQAAAGTPPGPVPLVLPMLAALAVKLVGIAEDVGPDGPVRTAMLSFRGDLIFAKEGEPVGTQYRVARISADVVELTDSTAGSTLRLALK